MFDGIAPTAAKTPVPGLEVIAGLLALSFVYGCLVAGVYRLTQGRARAEAGGLLATLVLLTVLVCMTTLVIGDNTARAFGLVGALSIVRFRTVVEDTRDTAFVIFAVVVGMGVGAGYIGSALVSMPFVALAAWAFRPRESRPVAASNGVYTLTVRVGLNRPADELLAGPFGRHLTSSRLTAAATARQGAALDLTYAVRLAQPDRAAALVAELNSTEGVQSAELKGG